MLITKAHFSDGSLQHPALSAISPSALRETVEALAFPRHYEANREANECARDWIFEKLCDLGFHVGLQGDYDNVIADSQKPSENSTILVGAHYDTVPGTPGADDNNSAISVCLEAAKVLSRHAEVPLTVAVFNREEDGLLGSSDFVRSLGPSIRNTISEAHIFEMVGYYTDVANSQSKPANMPIPIPDVGNFIGIISNSSSNKIASRVLRSASSIEISTPLISLKTFLGMEKLFRDLLRSDHTPFWQAGVPALMWTDTSNFRNPHYHAPTDTPETLDYEALADVTRILVGHILLSSNTS